VKTTRPTEPSRLKAAAAKYKKKTKSSGITTQRRLDSYKIQVRTSMFPNFKGQVVEFRYNSKKYDFVAVYPCQSLSCFGRKHTHAFCFYTTCEHKKIKPRFKCPELCDILIKVRYSGQKLWYTFIDLHCWPAVAFRLLGRHFASKNDVRSSRCDI